MYLFYTKDRLFLTAHTSVDQFKIANNTQEHTMPILAEIDEQVKELEKLKKSALK